jgi:3-methyladenine DNA glycosylase AlkC
MRIEAAANPNTSLEMLEALSRDGSIYVRHNVGGNPATSLQILEALSKDQRALVRGAVAGNPNSSLELLDNLSQDISFFIQDEVARVRGELAENPSTSPKVLEKLAWTEDPRSGKNRDWIRDRVAENPSTPIATLEKLSVHANTSTRWSVAENLSASKAILKNLAEDKDEYVRKYVASNPNLELSLIEKLSRDAYEDVVAGAAANPSASHSILEALSKDKRGEVREEVAGNPSSSLAVLELLSRDKNERVRRNVAENPSSSDQILAILAKDKDSDVRESAITRQKVNLVNPNDSDYLNIGADLLEELSSDPKALIRARIAEHPNTSSETLETLANDYDSSVRCEVAGNPRSSKQILEILATDDETAVRKRVLQNPSITTEILEILSRDEDRDIRVSVTLNSKTSIDLLETLKRDENEYSRGWAESVFRKKIFTTQSSGSTPYFLNKGLLKQKKEFQYFSDAMRLFKEDRDQEAVELLFELSEGGHIDSLEELFEIFLGQGDYEIVEGLLADFPDANNPRFLFLRAKLIEESDSLDLNAYIEAAESGSLSAMLALIEKYSLIDGGRAKKWLARAEKIGLTDIQHYRDMLYNMPLPKTLKIVVVTSDETRQWVQFVVQSYETSKAVAESFEFESLESAIEFCLSKKSGFDVIQVNESWVKLISKIGYRIKVVTHRNQVTIAEGIHDYWFGELNDIDAAVEELTSRDCDWELVYYISNDIGIEHFESNEDLEDDQDDYEEDFSDDDDELIICVRDIQYNRMLNDLNINPGIAGFNSFLVSLAENTDHKFLNINFENSVESFWFPIDNTNQNTFLKAVIHLGLILGYGQPGYGTSGEIPENFPNSAAGWQSPELLIWLNTLTADSDIDDVFVSVLKYLTESAYESDPGWTFILNGQGLRMSSIWTEESDIWGAREFRDVLPEVDIQVMREIWSRGETGSDYSFQGGNDIFRSESSHMVQHVLRYESNSETSPKNLNHAAVAKDEISREELVRRVAALWEEAIEENLANSGDVSFNAFLGAQYSLASLAGQCKITEEGFRIVESAFGELLLLVRDLDDDSDEDDEDDE